MRNIKVTIKREIFKRVFIDYNSDHRQSIFLAGTGRSGTTWLSDIINYQNEYRLIFEPFRPDKVPLCTRFRYRQYLRPENQDRDFIAAARAILSGKVRSDWTDRFNERCIASRRLIKDIRANLLLRWMHIHFCEMPIVLLLRHPCAVAYSRLKLNWHSHLEEFLAQEELMGDFLNPFRHDIERAQTEFEKQIFLWCIENYIPLKQFNRGEIQVVFYENLCKKPEDEIHKLFGFLGKDWDGAVLANLRDPSPTSRRERAVMSGDTLIDSWRKHITRDQTQRAVEILSLFGLDEIYSYDSMPNVDGVNACSLSFRLESHGCETI